MTTLTNRENAFLQLCQSSSADRSVAIENCRKVFGRPLITSPVERANVAAYLASQGWNGIERANLALADLNEAARNDSTLPDYVAGR